MTKGAAMCKISVVMPTMNADKYLRESIESILNQSFSDFEFIIVDDGSTDKTLDIIKSYNDPRIRVIDGPRTGIGAALNKGIDCAKGEYIARMDADDISVKDRFEKQVNYLDSNPDVALCGMFAMEFFMDGRPSRVWCEDRFINMETPGLIDQLLHTPVVCHPTVMFRKKVFAEKGLRYTEKYKHTEDQELWIRAMKVVTFHNIPEIGLHYRVHKCNKSIENRKEGDETLLKIKIDLMKWLLPSGNYDYDTVEKQGEYIEQIMRKNGIWNRIESDDTSSVVENESITDSFRNGKYGARELYSCLKAYIGGKIRK